MGSGRALRSRRIGARTALGLLLVAAFAARPACGQVGDIVINEVIAENGNEGPEETGGGHPDLVELHNLTGERILLGGATEASSWYLSDTQAIDPGTGEPKFASTQAWRFRAGAAIEPNGFLVIFCDSDLDERCEVHADFKIKSDGSEALLLWGPEGLPGERPLVDRVYLPPLRKDVSFGRYPDGAGPAPVPLEDTLNVFVYNPPGTSTFGVCRTSADPVSCGMELVTKDCHGEANGPGGNLEPRIEREELTTVQPHAGEAVGIVVSVRDDKEPTPGNIARVQVYYSVDGVEQTPVDLEFVEVRDGSAEVPARPLARWGIYAGAIPGQPRAARVQFELFVEDAEGLSSADPRDLCVSGSGPCDAIGLPGPDCSPDPENDLRFLECSVRDEYVVGYEPEGALAGLVINEVVSSQNRLLMDPSESTDTCDDEDETTACRFDDFIELYNGSGETIPLTGLWLSDRGLVPRSWPFPEGAEIAAGEYLIVWCDGDGGKCVREKVVGDGQDCPDPTDVTKREYHTNFSLDADGDQIYLFAPLAQGGFGVVHAAEFDSMALNTSLALAPDGCRWGEYQLMSGSGAVTPAAANGTSGECIAPPSDDPEFRRGDANDDGSVNVADPVFGLEFLFSGGPAPPCPDALDVNDDGNIVIADPIYLLNFLFSGGPAPPAPGSETYGIDPTADELGECATAQAP